MFSKPQMEGPPFVFYRGFWRLASDAVGFVIMALLAVGYVLSNLKNGHSALDFKAEPLPSAILILAPLTLIGWVFSLTRNGFRRKPVLVIDENGWTSFFGRKLTIPWSRIERINVVGRGSAKMVGVVLRDHEAALASLQGQIGIKALQFFIKKHGVVGQVALGALPVKASDFFAFVGPYSELMIARSQGLPEGQATYPRPNRSVFDHA